VDCRPSRDVCIDGITGQDQSQKRPPGQSFWADRQQVNSIKCTKWKLISVAHKNTYMEGFLCFHYEVESPKGISQVVRK